MIIDYIDDECVFCPRENETIKTHFFDDFEILIDNVQEMEEIRYNCICSHSF